MRIVHYVYIYSILNNIYRGLDVLGPRDLVCLRPCHYPLLCITFLLIHFELNF